MLLITLADFKTARKHLNECIDLHPSEEMYANELKELKQREKEHAELEAQGADSGGGAEKRKKSDDEEDSDDEAEPDDEEESDDDD